MKANPSRLIRAHYATLVDNRTDSPRLRDHLLFEGVPIVVCAGSWIGNVDLTDGVAIGLLTVAGLMSAFFFGAMLEVSMRALEWADERPAPGPDVSRHAEFLRQIAANAGYASLVCVLTATVFVVVTVTQDNAHAVLSALGLALATHVVLMLFMVANRLFALTEQRLTDARTGYGRVTPLPNRKRASGE